MPHTVNHWNVFSTSSGREYTSSYRLNHAGTAGVSVCVDRLGLDRCLYFFKCVMHAGALNDLIKCVWREAKDMYSESSLSDEMRAT